MGGSGICSRKASAQAGAPTPMLIAPRFAARVARVLVDPNGCAANTERWAAVEVAEQVAEVPVTEADATVEASLSLGRGRLSLLCLFSCASVPLLVKLGRLVLHPLLLGSPSVRALPRRQQRPLQLGARRFILARLAPDHFLVRPAS